MKCCLCYQSIAQRLIFFVRFFGQSSLGPNKRRARGSHAAPVDVPARANGGAEPASRLTASEASFGEQEERSEHKKEQRHSYRQLHHMQARTAGASRVYWTLVMIRSMPWPTIATGPSLAHWNEVLSGWNRP